MHARVALLGVAAAAALLLSAHAARAQIFSPGDLSKAHASIEGMRNCTKCHVEGGGGHSDERCLECHDEINRRLEGGTGYHSTVKTKMCAECHLEHRGRNKSIVDWEPSRDEFNHKYSGWPLEGPHKKPKCQDCHEPRRIDDEYVLSLVKEVGRESYLGVSTRCAACHHDEHRNQLGRSCQQCHKVANDDTFKDASAFDHNKPKDGGFPLVGKHKDVKCKDCHETLADTKAQPAFPKPRASSFLKVKNIEHASCVACHEDYHRGAMGKNCARCHNPKDWSSINPKAMDAQFHDKFNFQLRGEHTAVACKTCHGPFPGEAAKYKGLKHDRCADCHIDAHLGQIALDEGAVRCEKCHQVTGFIPVLLDAKLHESTHFPLEGSHRTVACKLCHKSDQRLLAKVPTEVKTTQARRGRQLLISEARIRMPDVVTLQDGKPKSADCDICHDDPHLGQFQKETEPPDPRAGKKACADCHTTAAFKQLKFNHDNSRFPRTGKHKDATCRSCHVPPPAKGDDPVVVPLRTLPFACSSCHNDAHVGQFTTSANKPPQECSACHSTDAFKPSVFDHDKQTSFALIGKHGEAKCEQCHPGADAKGTKIARYRPMPAACISCHEDQHNGAYEKYAPIEPGVGGVVLASNATPTPTPTPTATAPAGKTRCDVCHSPTGWVPAKFAHEQTGYTLTGKHLTVRCGTCHGSDPEKPIPMTCAGCHVDVHQQQFGQMCSSCHSTDTFVAPGFAVDAHRLTNFPLTGRHGIMPCDECHLEKRERSFARAPVECGACHQGDIAAASTVTSDHRQPPFSVGSCRDCHVGSTFFPALFPQHDQCFPITTGAHANVQCVQCHNNVAGTRFTGACTGVPVRCAECHQKDVEDNRHQAVSGYDFQSERCAVCHHTPR